MIKEFGFIRVGAIVPKIKVANPDFNSEEIIKQIKVASERGVDIISTPEMSLTGATCGDLLKQEILLQSALDNLKRIINETKELNIISIIGIPVEIDTKIISAAAVIQKGEVLALISDDNMVIEKNIRIYGKEVPFGSKIILEDKENKKFSFAVLAGTKKSYKGNFIYNKTQNGAKIIFDLSANIEIVGSHNYKKQDILVQSKNNICGYVYCSSGVNESSTDMVFAGSSMIYENGKLLKENERFDFDSNLIYSDVDVFRLSSDRNFSENDARDKDYRYVEFEELKNKQIENDYKIEREYAEYPFIPNDETLRNERCKDIINIQACGLAKRLMHTGIKKTVIGLSGGQDSTLAFLVIIEAYKKLGIDNSNLIAITMPGFGTTGRTYENACKLAKVYGATLKEISIKEACMVHFKDIELDENDRSVTYENVQARERTQILMDVANKEGALVVGTGDLSELALGWCTYNGDHMSMYSVNCGVPKTLVRTLIKWAADNTKNKTLYDILDTPISPELLPPDEYGNLVQKTENTIGPYVLHDFFIYHFLRYGASPKKILAIAKQTFEGKFKDEEIRKWLKVFIKRFFTQQFKRSCAPDGPKIGMIGLSPREDLKIPSDTDVSIWLKELEQLRIGIFGGAFNPPHKMHKEIAVNLLKKGYVDKIIYVPTGNNYNKPCLLDGKKRIEMIKCMFDEQDLNVDVSDFEVNGSLYTVNTLNHFKEEYPEAEIYFICGTDNLKEFNTWHNYKEILENYKLLVIARNNDDFNDIIEPYSEYKSNIILANIDMQMISSTMVRNEINEKGFTNELEKYLDVEVIDYLKNLPEIEVWKKFN